MGISVRQMFFLQNEEHYQVKSSKSTITPIKQWNEIKLSNKSFILC